MPKMLDLIRMSMRGELPPPPVAALIGFRPTAVEPGHAVVEFEAAERHANPVGTLHGGILCDVADAAMGIAYASTLEEGETFTTLELKINFLRPVWNARLRAVADVVNGGRTIGLVACDVLDEGDRLVARATSTCMTLRGDQSAGREAWTFRSAGGRSGAAGRGARGAGRSRRSLPSGGSAGRGAARARAPRGSPATGGGSLPEGAA